MTLPLRTARALSHFPHARRLHNVIQARPARPPNAYACATHDADPLASVTDLLPHHVDNVAILQADLLESLPLPHALPVEEEPE